MPLNEQNAKQTLSRSNWIDSLRGLAIILVIIGHQGNVCSDFFTYTSPIKMPLFFFISGFLFSYNKTLLEYLKKTFFRLCVPWMLLPIIPYLIKPAQIPGMICDLILGIKDWFMVCFVIDSVLVYCLLRIVKQDSIRIVASAVLAFVGLSMSYFGVKNICMVNTALVCQLYMVMAYMFKRHHENILNLNIRCSFWGLGVFAVLCYVGYQAYGGVIDVHLNRYYNIAYCIILIILGCISISVLFKNLLNKQNFLTTIGKGTLLIYLWSPYCMAILLKLSFLSGLDVGNWIVKTLCSLLTCLILGLVSKLFSRYIPFIIGEKRKNGKIVQKPNL